MAKVTLTIEDNEDGSIKVNVEANPPFDNKNQENLTPAHWAGFDAFQSLVGGDREVDVS